MLKEKTSSALSDWLLPNIPIAKAKNEEFKEESFTGAIESSFHLPSIFAGSAFFFGRNNHSHEDIKKTVAIKAIKNLGNIK